ncbi:MAG TPA: adenylate/guanylate cyclase domain-containing protein [Roseiflexaceae bacterium]
MDALPTGSVTFLFTDIEGSTRLWEYYPEAMRAALARHDVLIRAAIEAHGGGVFKTVGDAFYAVFAAAASAAAAALTIQRMLQREPWSETGPLRVRVALHTGAAETRDGDYFGPALNRVARMLAAGHGGQIVLSQSTQQLVRHALPPDATLRSLGAHRLRDLIVAEPIFQLVAADLPSEFPPLKTLGALRAALPTHLGAERRECRSAWGRYPNTEQGWRGRSRRTCRGHSRDDTALGSPRRGHPTVRSA